MGLLNALKKVLKKNEPKPKVTVKEPPIDTQVSINNEIEIDPVYIKSLSNGLQPGEIILIDWIDGHYIDSSFPGYFEYKYGINTEKSASKLLDKGFISEATPIESLKSFKVPELKEVLKQNELKVSGKKQELIDRLSENLSENEISNYIDKKPLKITSKGQEALDEYYYIVPAHKNSSQDGVYNVASAIKYVSKLDYKPNNGDISWALFQESSLKHHKEFN